MKAKLKIVRLCDQWNWAYDHITREQAVYSRHEIINLRLMDVKIKDLEGVDILYIPGPNMGSSWTNPLIANVRNTYPNCRIICGYAGEHEIMYPDADIIVSISAKFFPKLKEMYQARHTPVVFLPESADTEFFVPGKFPKNFTVGWSGRVAEVKRCHLLDKLAFPVIRKSDHGTTFFKEPGRSLQPMKDFYQSISALVLTSHSEAMPRVILEAMSCGLPVISTDVGSLRMVMNNMWLVPVHPENVVVNSLNHRLSVLANYPELAKEIGQQNRDFIVKNFSWVANQPIWDDFFNTVAKGHFVSAEILNRPYRIKYGEFEPALLK